MLKDIDRQYSMIHIAGREYLVRYSLNALLCLEMTFRPLSDILKEDFRLWSAETVIQLVRAALCSCPWNQRVVSKRDFDAVSPSLSELGELIRPSDLPLLRVELISAVIDSMPRAESAAENAEVPAKAFHEGHQRALFCDVMGRPEKEYWNSTNREITERIDCYFEVKGEKEAADLVQEFDDD